MVSSTSGLFFRTLAELSLSFPYKDRFNRSQKSKIVDKASCWDCDAFYIGKTKRRLHDRKTEHFKALSQIGHAFAVAEHSISTGHNIKWDHFEILASGQCDLQRKIKETLLIRDLKPALNENVGSENPRGEGDFLIRGYCGCAAGWGRIFTTGLTIMGSHFQ